MIIPVLISIIIYNIILTLFVVKIHNKIYGNTVSSTEKTTDLKNVHSPAQKEIVENPNTFNELSKKFDQELNKQSQEDIKNWIKSDEINHQNKLNKLNEDFKQY